MVKNAGPGLYQISAFSSLPTAYQRLLTPPLLFFRWIMVIPMLKKQAFTPPSFQPVKILFGNKCGTSSLYVFKCKETTPQNFCCFAAMLVGCVSIPVIYLSNIRMGIYKLAKSVLELVVLHDCSMFRYHG